MRRSHEMLSLTVAALLAVAMAGAAEADKPLPPMKVDKSSTGKAFGSSTETMTATVQAINLGKREVTLRGAKGEVETLVLGPEVKNLAQIAVGDQVVAEYHQGLFLALQAPGDPDVTPQLSAGVATAAPGEKPAAGVEAQIRATVTVKSIDMKKRIVTLLGPEGGEHRVEAGPGVQLEKLKVGDRIAATYTEAVAISVEPKHKH